MELARRRTLGLAAALAALMALALALAVTPGRAMAKDYYYYPYDSGSTFTYTAPEGTTITNPTKGGYSPAALDSVDYAYGDDSHKTLNLTVRDKGNAADFWLTVTLSNDTTDTLRFIKDPTPTTYKLTLAADPAEGGVVKADPKKDVYKENDVVKITATPAEGYKWNGWSTGDTATSMDILMDQDKTFTAQFTKIPAYAITVENDGNGTAEADAAEAVEGATVKLTATPKDRSYEFDKWVSDDVKVENDSFKMPAKKVTVKATFKKKEEPKSATLTFDLAGGTLDGKTGTYTMTAKVGETVKLPAAPTRDGYTFKCWRGSEYAAGAEYKVEGDHAFTAEWEKATAQYAITYDANGGKGSMDKQAAEAGATVTLAANAFKRDGYTFAGWNTKADGTGDKYADKATVTPTADMTLYAQWQAAPAQYTITYDANGGAGTMSAQTIEAGKSAALTANGFARDGYTFAGWNTAKDGSGTAYADKATVTPTADMALYAQWQATPAKYTVTFDANGGTGTMDALTVDAGNSVVLTANAFKRDGYTFAGWNTKADGTGDKCADKAEVKVEGDMTLYAQWTKGSAAKSSPKTGDASSTLIVVLSATAIAALCLLAWSTRKRNARAYKGMHARR